MLCNPVWELLLWTCRLAANLIDGYIKITVLISLNLYYSIEGYHMDIKD